jgi:hypothetical protein
MPGRKGQKPGTRGKILATCPDCQGTGKVPKKLPFLANPKAPLTRPDRLGLETCPKCNSSGRVGME